MAISTAVQPIRVEPTDASLKSVKTVTIANPPTASNSTKCNHTSNQHSLCPKCGIVSPKLKEDKKSILVHKEHLVKNMKNNEINKEVNESLSRRHSDDIARVSTIKPIGKQKQMSKTTDNLHHPKENIKSKSILTDTKHITKHTRFQLQRSSSLKNPAKTTSMVSSNFKNTNSKAYDKRQPVTTGGGSRVAQNTSYNINTSSAQMKTSLSSKPSNLTTTNIAKV